MNENPAKPHERDEIRTFPSQGVTSKHAPTTASIASIWATGNDCVTACTED